MPGATSDELVDRYRRNYGLPAEVELTEDMVLAHWDLERRLTRELRASSPATRWETFDGAYTELYRALPWLRASEQSAGDSTEWSIWPALVGPAPRRLYEVGSGEGALARYLASVGYVVRATEITLDRGDRADEAVSWGQTDGVHLDRFEPAGSFDAVLSNQVLEHLHPDDLDTHLRSAWLLLRPGGRLVFATPHAYTGPHDVSRVFGRLEPEGMHLREYTYAELVAAVRRAGFVAIAAPLRLPARVRARWSPPAVTTPSQRFLVHLLRVERLIARAGPPPRRARAARLARAALFAANITLVAVKPASG